MVCANVDGFSGWFNSRWPDFTNNFCKIIIKRKQGEAEKL